MAAEDLIYARVIRCRKPLHKGQLRAVCVDPIEEARVNDQLVAELDDLSLKQRNRAQSVEEPQRARMLRVRRGLLDASELVVEAYQLRYERCRMSIVL